MTKARKSVRRSARGQGLVEASCGLILLAALIVGGVLFILNMGQYLLYQQRINDVADKAVIAAKASLVWNNAMRPRAELKEAEKQALQTANSLLSVFGLPQTSNLDLTIEGPDTLVLQFDVEGLAMPNSGCGIFPVNVKQHARAAYVIPQESPPCYLTITVDNDLSRSIVIPAYGPHHGDYTNAGWTLQQRLNQGNSGYARLLPNRQAFYGQCQLTHSGQTTAYKFTQHK